MARLCHFQIEVVSVAFCCKTLNAGCSKDSEARRAKFDELRRRLSTLNESGERNEAYEVFSAACWICELILAIAGPFITLERREIRWLKP